MLAYKDLEVWQRSIQFAVDVIDTVDTISTDRKHYRLFEQIEASSSSVSMNIAEGKGRFSKKEFTQYLYISRGSLYETLTLLEILCRKNWITENKLNYFEKEGIEIASMLKGLINSINR